MTTNAAANGQASNAASPVDTDDTSQSDGAQTGQAPSAAAVNGTAADASATSTESGEQHSDGRLQRENQSLRRRLRELEEGSGTTEGALRTELADLRTRLEESDRRAADRAIQLEAFNAASRLHFRNPELAYRLIDRGAVEFDKRGEPKEIEATLKQLLDANPYLAATEGDFGGGDRGATAAAPSDMNALLRRGRSGG